MTQLYFIVCVNLHKIQLYTEIYCEFQVTCKCDIKISYLHVHEVKKSVGEYILQVIPLWFEIYGEERPADIWKIIVVESSAECRRERTLRRSTTDMNTFDLILNNQANDFERRKIADDIIFNQGTIEELRVQVNSIHERYIKCLRKT